MALGAGQSRPDLDQPGWSPPAGMDFFQLLRLLEGENSLFGHGSSPATEPARLGQQVRQNFAAQDVGHFTSASQNQAAKVRLMNLGLLGPEGPMPLHITRWTLDRLSQRWFTASGEGATSDTTFADFCDMLQHRIITLFYRAWADTRPEVQVQRPDGGRLQGMLNALGGVTPSADSDLTRQAPVRREQAAALAHQVRGPERLSRFLAAVIGAPVSLAEYAGNWLPIPPTLQSRLGTNHIRLGQGATIGAQTYQRQNKIEVRVGPLNLPDFLRFAPGGPNLPLLRKAILSSAGHELDADIRLILRHQQVPAAIVGQSRLSRTAWLAGRPARDADDLRFRADPGYDRGQTGAAA